MIRTCQGSTPPMGRAFILDHFNNTIYVFALGLKPIKFASLYQMESMLLFPRRKEDITKAHLLNHEISESQFLPQGWSLAKSLCIC